MKHLLKKCTNEEDFRDRLLEWRNVPRSGSTYSPAELFFGRRLRTQLPTFICPSTPTMQEGRHLSSLSCGDQVLLQNQKSKLWDTHGVITSVRPDGRSYVVECDDGTIYLRNRLFIRPIKAATSDSPNRIPSPQTDTKKKLRKVSFTEPIATLKYFNPSEAVCVTTSAP